jgi:hypothetical protein
VRLLAIPLAVSVRGWQLLGEVTAGCNLLFGAPGLSGRGYAYNTEPLAYRDGTMHTTPKYGHEDGF